MSTSITFKAILPTKPMAKKPFIAAIKKETEALAGDIQLEFLISTASWKTDVKFEVLTDIKGNNVEILVGTDNAIYRYVNDGTKPHIIRPRNKKMLVFMTGYKAKSKPGRIPSYMTSPASGGPVFAKVVHHPGTKARKFDSMIKKKFAPIVARRLQAAIDHTAEASGYLLRK